MPKITINKVASPVLMDANLPKQPEIRAIANDVLGKLRYAFTAIAADIDPAASNGFDKSIQEFLATRSAATRAQARENARAIMESASLRRNQFGRYAAIDLRDYRTLGWDGIESRVSPLQVNSEALKKGLNKLSARLATVPAEAVQIPNLQGKQMKAIAGNPDLEAGLRFKKVKLIVRQVRCVVETDEIGSDEINLGGSIVGATGNTKLVDQFQVSDDFDEGERRNLNKVFGSYTIRTEPQGFPYVYTAVIVMAEKDDGGFYRFLKDLWDKLGDKVQDMVKGAVGAGLGAALGSLAGPIGTIIGAVFGAMIGWLLSLFNNPDDIVGIKTVQLGLGASTRSYYDWAKLTTPQGLKGTVVFKGDGGRYEVDVSWKVFTQ